jgi:predicted Zn-dependent peptidase
MRAPSIEPRRRHLGNGLTALAVHRPYAVTAVVHVDVRVGSRFEGAREGGLSHFLEHMVFRGCDGYPSPTAVDEAAERIGAALDANTGRDSTRYQHIVDPSHLDDSLALLARLLSTPLFLGIDNEREVIIEESLDEVDDRGNLIGAEALSRALVWPESALGRRIIGDPRDLRRLTVDDLRRHHGRFYGAANMVVTTVGPMDATEQLDAIEAAFSGLVAGTRHHPPDPGGGPNGPARTIVRDDHSQVEIRMAFRTPGTAHADQAALRVMAAALDDGLASRLHARLGTDLGLAYDMWALWEPYFDTGAFEVGGMVSPGKALRFVTEAQAVLERLIAEPPEGDELARVRFRSVWGYTQTLAVPESIAELVGPPHLDEAEPAAIPERLQALDRVSPEDIQRVARETFQPGRYTLAAVGDLDRTPRREIARAMKRIGG